jgi:hypothetical protein
MYLTDYWEICSENLVEFPNKAVKLLEYILWHIFIWQEVILIFGHKNLKNETLEANDWIKFFFGYKLMIAHVFYSVS